MRLLAPVATTVALAAAAIVPATAVADKSFKGKTAQNRSVSLTTGDDNVIKTLRINWITRSCSQSSARFQSISEFPGPFDTATPDEFADEGSFTVRDSGGIRSRVTIAVTGRRALTDPANPATENWSGTVKATVVVRRVRRGRSKVIDRCTLRSRGWYAEPAP